MEMESLWFGFILIMFLSSKSANGMFVQYYMCDVFIIIFFLFSMF